MEIIYCEQGPDADEWKQHRAGIVTCSALDDVMSKGRTKDAPSLTRRTYMLKLIGERFTGEPGETWGGNKHTERGQIHEPEARRLYQEQKGVEVEQVGIILNHGIGYSPDGLVGASGAVEIKSKLPHLILAYHLSKGVPKDHLKQIQGGLWVSEREWCDLVVYWPGIPLYVKRVFRDEKMIADIKEAVEKFYTDMDALINQLTRI